MAKQVLRSKPKTPTAVKAKPTALEAESTALVEMPKSTALSLDVGLEALRDYAAAASDDEQIVQLRESNTARRGRAQVSLAIAFYKAALSDKSIDLSATLLEAKGNKPAKDKLGAQLRLVVGLAELKGKRTVWTEDARALQYAMPGDDEKTIKRKNSLRINFTAMMSKAAQVALEAVENGLKLERDKETGLARLSDQKSGKAMKEHFGVSSVLLNEDQNAQVIDKKGNVRVQKLKALPSFAEIQRKVAERHGKTIVDRKVVHATVDPIKDMIARCGHLVAAIEKLPAEIPEELNKALVALHSAIDTKIA